jgi:hypothetical protein
MDEVALPATMPPRTLAIRHRCKALHKIYELRFEMVGSPAAAKTQMTGLAFRTQMRYGRLSGEAAHPSIFN